jgi:hypothetical protein
MPERANQCQATSNDRGGDFCSFASVVGASESSQACRPSNRALGTFHAAPGPFQPFNQTFRRTLGSSQHPDGTFHRATGTLRSTSTACVRLVWTFGSHPPWHSFEQRQPTYDFAPLARRSLGEDGSFLISIFESDAIHRLTPSFPSFAHSSCSYRLEEPRLALRALVMLDLYSFSDSKSESTRRMQPEVIRAKAFNCSLHATLAVSSG